MLRRARRGGPPPAPLALRPRKARDGTQIPGGTIEVDGEVFHKDGKFLIAGW